LGDRRNQLALHPEFIDQGTVLTPPARPVSVLAPVQRDAASLQAIDYLQLHLSTQSTQVRPRRARNRKPLCRSRTSRAIINCHRRSDQNHWTVQKAYHPQGG